MKIVEEKDIDHLVIDGKEDVGKEISVELLELKFPPLSTQPLQNIKNKEIQNDSQSISITPIEPNRPKEPYPILKKSISSSMVQELKDRTNINYSHLYSAFEN